MYEHEKYSNLFIVNHPLVQHKLSHMRDETRTTMGFRRLLREIALLMGYEITRDLPIKHETIQTPICEMSAPFLDGKKIAIVPILRAGLVMADGLLDLMPAAKLGHIGLYRHPETHMPVEYMVKLPTAEDRLFILVDPMLATGNSAAYACDVLNKHGVPDERIKFLSLVAAPEGIEVFQKSHPRVPLFTASLDEKLNEKAYIVPGLGDAGDRMFGTM